jgi:hypothetical protein
MRNQTRSIIVLSLAIASFNLVAADFSLEVKQLTHGPKQHFFGYIGHVRTIPWNQSGRYLVALQTEFQDRMPKPNDAAEIILIDTQQGNALTVVERSRAWNPQQGTMLYWNPREPETQFFFNDRDPKTQDVFCVLYDIQARKRVAEYRFADTPIGNSGVAQNGGWFLAINYARMARLRPVTGYPGAHDWTIGVMHPENDGIFKVNVVTREKQLLVSFKQLADALRRTHPEINGKELFINHTLWNRDDDRIFFFVRGDFDKPSRCNIACTMHSDGSGLRPLATFIGGHPDWESGHRMIGRIGADQVLYDTDEQRVVEKLGTPTIFPKPEGDIALSPDGRWFVNGHGEKGKNFYTILRRSDGVWSRSAGFEQGGYVSGDLRLDPGPLWNRDSTKLLVPGMANDDAKTRQLFVIEIKPAT